jgi:spore germination protein GerM
MKGIETTLIAVMAGVLIAGVASPAYAEPANINNAPAQTALQTLALESNSPLPAGTHLLGISIHDGLATVNFDRALTANFQGGDTEAAQTVNAILRTLGRFPTVSRVQILVDGQIPGSLGGLIVLSSPLPVIRPHGSTLWYHHSGTHK